MPRDIYFDGEEWEEESAPKQPQKFAGTKAARPAHQDAVAGREDDGDKFAEELLPAFKQSAAGGQNGSLSTIKDYVIVALLAGIIFIGFNNYIFARTGNIGGGGGCCGGSSGGAAVSQEEIRQIGLEYYVSNYGDAEVEAVVQDFGCHQEIHIYKDGQLIKRIGYAYGQVYEL